MTIRERAEDLVRRFDEPVMDKTNYRVQAMINMTEEVIIAAVEEEREACYQLVDGLEAQASRHPAIAAAYKSACGIIAHRIRTRSNNDGGTK